MNDTPHFRLAIRELACLLPQFSAQILLCHGYKAGILGRIAARRVGIPVAAVSRGWTYQNPKVLIYEILDRINLRGWTGSSASPRGRPPRSVARA